MTRTNGRLWRRIAGLCALASVALTAGVSQAHAAAITEFSSGLESGSSPFDMVAGPDGNVWFTDNAAIGRITPAGAITEFSAGLNPGSNPDRITTGADGNLWFNDTGTTHAIGRITPAGAITEFSAGLNPGSRPFLSVTGPDGNLWFNDEGTTPAIGRITPAGAITEFSAGLNAGSAPYGVVVGPDRNLWFIDEGTTHAIGRITPAGAITEFSAGLNSGSRLRELVVGPDGNLWFTDEGTTPAIGRVTPAGVITEFSAGLSAERSPDAIVAGADGNLWFTAEGTTPAIGRITPAGAITAFTSGLPSDSVPQFIIAGADGNLWFNDEAASAPAIGKVSLQIPPAASTGAASAVTTSTATLSGTVNPLGASTTILFTYGTTPAYGSSVAVSSLAASGKPSNVNAALSGLPAGTVIYYQLVASNAFGSTAGGAQSFTTAPAPPLPLTPLMPAPQSTKASFDDQQITLRTPSPLTCSTSASRLAVTLTSTTIAKSKSTHLKFTRAAFFIDKGIKHTRQETLHTRNGKKHTVTVISYSANTTTRHLPATLALSLSGLKSSPHTLEVTLYYTETKKKHGHKKIVTVTKTLSAKFTVC